MKKILTKKGFTLIELIVVIGILAVLAAVLIPSISNYVAQAREATNNANARALYSEVSAEFAMGTLSAAGNRTEAGITCSWTVTASNTLATFTCAKAATNPAAGNLTVTFTP